MSIVAIVRISIAASLSLWLVPSLGHHSEAGFDTSAVVAFEGVVTQYSWRNPHVYIRVEGRDAADEPIAWEVETGATPIMRRSGWTAESLQAGDRISVRGHPERDTGRNYVLLLSLDKADGSTLAQFSGDPSDVGTASSLAGVWKGQADSIGPFFEALSQVPLTEAGAEARDSYDFYTDSPAAQCVGPTTPTIVAVGLYVNEIELGEDAIVIRSEFFDSDRTIYMDGRGHPPDGQRTHLGHSVGHWENDVLVVDTRLFSDHRSGNGNGVPSGAQKHVVERYALSEDGSHIAIDLFLEDPQYLAEPFSGRVIWNYTPQFEVFRYDCHPETSRRFRLD